MAQAVLLQVQRRKTAATWCGLPLALACARLTGCGCAGSCPGCWARVLLLRRMHLPALLALIAHWLRVDVPGHPWHARCTYAGWGLLLYVTYSLARHAIHTPPPAPLLLHAPLPSSQSPLQPCPSPLQAPAGPA